MWVFLASPWPCFERGRLAVLSAELTRGQPRQGPGAAVASQLWKMKEKKGLKANDIVHKLLKELDKMNVPLVRTVWKLKFYGAFVLNRRVLLHAIDATPARAWRCAPDTG